MPPRARILAHPVHPALVHFPIGLWFAVVVWNVAGWLRPDPLWWQLGYWCLALGLLAALPAILAGLLDYLALAPNDAALDTATAHMMVMLGAVAAFGAGWLVRHQAGAGTTPPAWAFGCDFAGAVLLSVGGWLGGTLVYRHGLGVGRSRQGNETGAGGRPAQRTQ